MSTLNGKLIVLMGGSGFIGNYVAQALLQRGARVRIASRDPERARKLKPLANLGQMQLARCDATNRDSVRRTIAGADGVVNLVGAFEGNIMRLMGEAPGWMAEAAAETGAGLFVHVSAIVPEDAGVDEEGEDPIVYAAAKLNGELAVKKAFPQATILRPSILFGEDDGFLTMFAKMIRNLPVLPVFGPDKPLQLVHVDDVAEAIAVVLEQPREHGGKIYELGGPETLTMLEVNERIAAAQRRKRTFLPMPDGVSGLFAAMPGTPMGRDQWRLLKEGSTVSGKYPGFEALGIVPKPLDLFLDRWMTAYRRQGRFTEKSFD